MLHAIGPTAEDARGLDDKVHLVADVVEVCRIALSSDSDLLAVDFDPALARADLASVAAVDRVVLKEVRKGPCVGEVVDGDNFNTTGLGDDAEDVATDSTETVDGDTHGYCSDWRA